MDEEDESGFSGDLGDLVDELDTSDVVDSVEPDERDPEDIRILTPEQRRRVAEKTYDNPDEVSSEIADYIRKIGAVDLIETLGNSGSELSFNELRELVPNSSATLNKRLDEGVELGLISRRIDASGRGSTPVYNLRIGGKVLFRQLNKTGILDMKSRIMELERSLESQKEKLHSEIEDGFFVMDWRE